MNYKVTFYLFNIFVWSAVLISYFNTNRKLKGKINFREKLSNASFLILVGVIVSLSSVFMVVTMENKIDNYEKEIRQILETKEIE